uniref:EH signature domain-containing protein n=1 Tax=Rheinheimera sp. TaxID=1869214 RepID=UPI0040475690
MLGNFGFPEIPPASGMQKLAKSIDGELDELLFKDVRLPELPPRDISTILNLAEAGLQAEISVLEWISLLNGKEQWDTTHFNQERTSNELIWRLACSNHGLRYLLYWRFAVHLDGQDMSFPRGLIRQFAHFQHQLAEVDKQRTLLLGAIYSGDISELCKSALKFRMVPINVLNKCGLPGLAAFSQKTLKGLARYWVEHAKQFGTDALFAVINKLKAEGQDTFYSSALLDIPVVQLEQQKALVNRIVSIYSPYIKDTRFKNLNQAAQQVVRDLIGAMSFGDFSKLIDKLTEQEVAKKLGLEEWEIRQLNSRVAFWSNYQSRFLGFSVFLPSSTFTLLKQLNFHTDDMLFYQLSNSSCEVCVLEFENHFVLEFLRGGSSGVRLIDKHSQEAQVLKNVGSVSSQQQLEVIPFLAEHDHVVYWQNSCEKMLRTEFNILPNRNLKRFFITNQTQSGKPFYQEYSQAKGLPSLTREQFLKRQEALDKELKRLSRHRKPYQDRDQIYFALAEQISEVFVVVLKKHMFWIGVSKKHGWASLDRRLRENNEYSEQLRFLDIMNNVSFGCHKTSWNEPDFTWGPNYFKRFDDIDSLRIACCSFLDVITKLPNKDVLKEFHEVLEGRTLNNRAPSEADLIALASAQGGAHLDNRHKGGVLKIALQKSDREIEKLLMQSGFKEMTNSPLVFWKK